MIRAAEQVSLPPVPGSTGKRRSASGRETRLELVAVASVFDGRLGDGQRLGAVPVRVEMDDDPTVIANAVHRSREIILTTSGVPEDAVHPLARVGLVTLRRPFRECQRGTLCRREAGGVRG